MRNISGFPKIPIMKNTAKMEPIPQGNNGFLGLLNKKNF
jgi:hypothetical protein